MITLIVQICPNCKRAANEGQVKHPIKPAWEWVKCARTDQVFIEIQIPEKSP